MTAQAQEKLPTDFRLAVIEQTAPIVTEVAKVKAQVLFHDREIRTLQSDLRGLGTKMDTLHSSIERGIDKVFNKLNQHIQDETTQRAEQNALIAKNDKTVTSLKSWVIGIGTGLFIAVAAVEFLLPLLK